MNPDLSGDTIVLFDERFVPLRDAKIGILTHGLNYGTGVFEGIRGYWVERQKELFLVRIEDHYRRWLSNCAILRIYPKQTASELCDLTVELIRHNQFRSNLYIRPLAWLSAEKIGVHPDQQFTFAITAIPFGDYIDSRNGIHLGVVSWRRVQDTAIPTRAKICGCYVNSALASDEARRNGFDEAIFLNEDGHIAEGATCNLFIVRNGKLITPAVTDNILEGITRSCIIELARREMRLDVVERSIDRTELYYTDEAFLTGTAVEVAPVTRIDHRPVGNGALGPITLELRSLYFEATRGRIADYQHWLHRVYQPIMALA